MGQDPISPGPTRNPLSLSPYAIRIWIDLCVLCMRLVQALLRHIVLCARGGHPRTPQHYPCNDVGRHQKGLVSTSLFVASCAGRSLFSRSREGNRAKGGAYSGHRCLGRRLSSGLSGLDSCGLLGRSVPGRVREVESGEWPLSALHGLRQVGGLSSFPVTMTMSQSFSFWVW